MRRSPGRHGPSPGKEHRSARACARVKAVGRRAAPRATPLRGREKRSRGDRR
ncbi:hypothetical protein FRX31_012688, partial [Thalictrum thalictroides]